MLAVVEGFPLYVIMRGAEHSAIAAVNELKIVVNVLTWVPNITTSIKKNDLNLHNFFFYKEKIIMSRIPIFVYSWRGERGIVQPSFVNTECCASLCDDYFSSIYRWTKFGLRYWHCSLHASDILYRYWNGLVLSLFLSSPLLSAIFRLNIRSCNCSFCCIWLWNLFTQI